MKVGRLVKLSHLDKSEQVAIFRVVDSGSDLQNRWSCLRSHRQYSADRPYCRRSALDRLNWGCRYNGRRWMMIRVALPFCPAYGETI